MIKFILIGGYPHKAKDGGRAMCVEATAGIEEPVKVLICLFARRKKDWGELFRANAGFFQRNLPGVRLDFSLADKESFLDQIDANGLIYFSGGDTMDLVKRLDKIDGWQDKLKGKNVMGSSAGADILSKYNYDIESGELAHGYGLAPVKTIVHYGSSQYAIPIGWEEARDKLDNYKEKLPVWTLVEGEHKVIVTS